MISSSSRILRAGIALLVLANSLLACTSVEKTVQTMAQSFPIMDVPGPALPDETPAEFKLSIEKLETGNFEGALNGFAEYLRKNPTSQWTQAALFNSARALESLERWSEARDLYRQVILNTNSAPRIQSLALYRISFCHEAPGDDQETVAVLHDILNRSVHLPVEVNNAELPARLAAAYARVGNFERAVEFYRLAESGIYRLQMKNKGQATPPWLSRTLFFMGNTSLRQANWDDFGSHLRPLGRSQIYLLQAAELSSPPWSADAAKKLISSYGNLWTVIETAPVPKLSDPLVAKRKVQEKQWQRALLIMESVQELRARALPASEKMSPEAQEIFTFLTDLEARVARLFNERPAGEGLTSEALQRKHAIRGRVIAPDDSLESRFLKGGREVKVLPEPSEDPNL